MAMCLPTIDFEIGDDGISLVTGQVIDDEYEGWGVHVTTDDPANHPAMIFDSANPTGGDLGPGCGQRGLWWAGTGRGRPRRDAGRKQPGTGQTPDHL